MSVFDGMHPLRMQRPPSFLAPSMTATRFPRPAAMRAALKPADPPPMATKSKERLTVQRPFCAIMTWRVFSTIDASSMNEKLRI